LGPVYDMEIECWRILTDREIHGLVKKLIIAGNIRIN
jgi:hypothetical protein